MQKLIHNRSNSRRSTFFFHQLPSARKERTFHTTIDRLPPGICFPSPDIHSITFSFVRCNKSIFSQTNYFLVLLYVLLNDAHKFFGVGPAPVFLFLLFFSLEDSARAPGWAGLGSSPFVTTVSDRAPKILCFIPVKCRPRSRRHAPRAHRGLNLIAVCSNKRSVRV